MAPTDPIDPWLVGVRGDEVPALANASGRFVRVEAGPGTGKTFGLRKRVLRALHPAGQNLGTNDVLVVAFNRVIAEQLAKEIETELTQAAIEARPKISTIHALCLRVIGEPLRPLLSHEREAMIYDVLKQYPGIRARFVPRPFDAAEQALLDHEAGHSQDVELWQAVMQWLTRHRATLISDLPGRLRDHLQGGDFPEEQYQVVVVDEFQDLTAAEQDLCRRLCSPTGELIALGDSRQSIYAFRGNDREGLKRLAQWAAESGSELIDVPLRTCQRCPPEIVQAANQLMQLSGQESMHTADNPPGEVRVVYWKTPEAEAKGMAQRIVANVAANPNDDHLVMVTRRRFGYLLRDEIHTLAPDLRMNLKFDEGLLESWPAREAFLFLCLLADPDPATWRAWLGYQNIEDGQFKAPERNADAYLRFLAAHNDQVTAERVLALAAEPKTKNRGAGGQKMWDRAKRFGDLRDRFASLPLQPVPETIAALLAEDVWCHDGVPELDSARLDLRLLYDVCVRILVELEEEERPEEVRLQQLARRLRYRIATREPVASEGETALQVMTLWGAKGVTAHHVYVLGLCDEALPGERREEYPGTDFAFVEEQRRIFYVSITRAKRSLVLSRARRVRRSDAQRMGLSVGPAGGMWPTLTMSRFMRDIQQFLPEALDGEEWNP